MGITDVKSLQFVFGTQQNGWVGYNELAAQGAPSAPGLTWTGLQGSGGNGNWDFLTQNWTDTPTLTQSLAYADSNAVTFDNTGAASGNTNISITSNVSPVSVTFNNSSTPYTFSAGDQRHGRGHSYYCGGQCHVQQPEHLHRRHVRQRRDAERRP